MRNSDFSADQGSLGEAGGFAVFASEEEGNTAAWHLLHTDAYQNGTVADAIARWAPSKENDTPAYQRFVQKLTGLQGTRKLSSLYGYQLFRVLQAIRRYEGWREGTVTNQRTTSP